MKAKTDESKNLFIIAGIVIVLLLIALIFFNQSTRYTVGTSSGNLSSQEYYDQLDIICTQDAEQNCCMSSVKEMRAGGYELAVQGLCDEGSRSETLTCGRSYKWCVPE